MKKILAVLVALMMSLCAVSALATTAELDWSNYAADMEAYGQIYELNSMPVQFWIPNGLEYVEPTEEDEEDLICLFIDKDETAYVAVYYYDSGCSGITNEDLLESFQNDECLTNVAAYVVNGVECVTANDAEDGVSVIAFCTQNDYILEFDLFGADTEYEQYLPYVGVSITAVD